MDSSLVIWQVFDNRIFQLLLSPASLFRSRCWRCRWAFATASLHLVSFPNILLSNAPHSKFWCLKMCPIHLCLHSYWTQSTMD